MKNRLSPTTTTTTTERCVELKIILPSSGKLRVNESVLIPEGTPVDAAANTADINRLQSEAEEETEAQHSCSVFTQPINGNSNAIKLN